MKKIKLWLLFLVSIVAIVGCSNSVSKDTQFNEYELIVLGAKGGIQDGNLTAFLLSTKESENYITLDAGSIVNGLVETEKRGNLDHIDNSRSEYSKAGYVFRDLIKGYFVSHGHLDHVAGLVISSPSDTKKGIWGLETTHDTLKSNYFNWRAWPDFTDGAGGIGVYSLNTMTHKSWYSIEDTQLQVKAYPLSHGGVVSTAFLVRNPDDQYFLFFGDTGADEVEKASSLDAIWRDIAPLIDADKLRGMVIEVSFPNSTPDKYLFGHLTPKWLMHELEQLKGYTSGGSIEGLSVVVSHIKYSLKWNEALTEKILGELNALNGSTGVRFIIPEQGELLYF
ncbi:3',5'-cyclic-nucleotide phosphodiesterase [Vibrio maritimus]|uniref:3',5'-cyclic-nucleotide phosphodiesterase n=1 Tax=Vibrio maritimus TaxID=990268 RepID=UPI00373623AF